MKKVKIDGWLSRDHRGTYVFSAWKPEIKMMGQQKVLHQREKAGQVDPWWFGLDKPYCSQSMEAVGVQLQPLESVEAIWHMEIKE